MRPITASLRSRFASAMGGTLAAIAACALCLAAELPEWAYPVKSPNTGWDAVVLKGLPGSTRKFTQAQIEDNFDPPDWFPEDHPAMPEVVAHGPVPRCQLAPSATSRMAPDILNRPTWRG